MPQDSNNSSPITRDRHGPQRPNKRAERGFALVEVAIGLLVIAIATLGGVSWTVSGVSLDAANRETAAANDVLRRVMEEIQSVPFDEIYARFNANPDDDPDGEARGSTFTVYPDRKERFLVKTGKSGKGNYHEKSEKSGGTSSQSEKSGGWTWGERSNDVRWKPKSGVVAYRTLPIDVTISFPEDDLGRLSEVVPTGAWSSQAWDLNADGRVEAGDLSTSYSLLPVRIKMTWQSARGKRSTKVVRIMTRRRLGENE